jgi:hypothetical protein
MPPILTKRIITYHLYSMKIIKNTTHDIGNLGPGLGQAHKCCGVKPVNGIPTTPF